MESLEAAGTHQYMTPQHSQLLTVPARFIVCGATMLAADSPNHLCTVDWLELTKLIPRHTIRNHCSVNVPGSGRLLTFGSVQALLFTISTPAGL